MLLLLGIGGVKGQLSLTNLNPSDTIDFSKTVSGVSNGAFTGAGFQSTPTAGQLNSNAWAVTGWSDGTLAFAGTRTSGDYARGTAAAAVTTGGFYAYTATPQSVSNPCLMIQPGGSDFAPGTLTLRIQNNGTTNLTQLIVSYNIYVRNDQGRSTSLNFSHSSDNSTYTSVGGLDYTSPTTAAGSWALVGSSPSRTTTITGLNIAPTEYYFIRWSSADVGGGGSRDELGLDDIIATATFVSSSSSSSNIIANTSFTYPTNIDYTAYQSASGLTNGNSIEVGQFVIQDGGGSADADALATTLTACSLTVANSDNLRALAIFDGTTNVAEITSVLPTSFFSGLNLVATDDGSKTFSIRATFKTSVTDNQQIQFTMASATASSPGSAFAAANAGGATTSVTGDNNRIEVSTTDIIFDQNASNVAQNAVMNPSPTVRAVDGNVNFDLDNTSNVVMTISTGSTTFGGSATTTVAMVAGNATFNNLVFSTAANTNALTATQGAFTDISSNFNVTSAAPEINVKQNITDLPSGSGSHNAGNILSGNSGSAITFTIENLGSANLTYSSITSSNTTDFTLDLTGTSTPIAPSNSTTFNVTFNPTTAGGKSTTITINNNDADEGTYTFTITGTGTVSSASNIITDGGYSYGSNIDYASFQTASTLTTGNSIGVNGLIIQDGSGSPDADNLGTTLTDISFTTGGSTAIRTAALFDGSTNVSEVAVDGATTISFSGLTLNAADASTKNFELRVTYQAGVTDNQQITFTVSSATASATTSGFAAANAGAAASASTGDINRLEVTADRLAFVQQPSNVSINTAMTPAPTVSANDALGNRDLDYTTDMTASTTGTFGTSTNPVTPVDGLGTFSNLQFSATATGRTIEVSSGSLTASGNSNTFDVSSLIMPGDIAFVSYQTDNPDGFSIITFVDIPASQTLYFTENAWTTTSGPLASNESTITWTTPSSVIPAGTVINFTHSSGSAFTVTPSGNGSAVGSTTPGFSTNGEQILMFRGTNSTTPTAFICGVSTTGWINSGSTTSNISYLPSDLSLNITGITFTSHTDNGYYNGPQSGSISTIKALVNNGANWLRSGSIQTLPSWTFTLNATTTTLAANASVENLSLASGETFVIGANTLTINGAVSGSGTLTGGSTSNLTIGGAAGTIAFTSGSRTLNNLVIGTGANASLTLGSALDVAPAGSITFNAAGTKSLTLNSQTLTLKSDATGTASIGNTNSATISGNITVERFIPAQRKFRFLASPVVGATAAQWRDNGGSTPGIGTHITGTGGASNGFDVSTTNAPSAFSYTEANGDATNTTIGGTDNAGWSAFTSGSQALTNGAGYRVLVRGDRTISLTTSPAPAATATTLSVTGTYPSSPVTINVTRNADVAGKGWNLVGNPFPSAISWNAISKSPEITGTYQTFNPTTNAYVAYNGTTGDATDNISSGQGFLVFVTNGSNHTSGSITIEEADKVSANGGSFFKTSIKNHLKVTLKYDSNNVNNTFIHFRDQATELFDAAFDAPKLTNPGVNISSKDLSGNTYAINSLPLQSLQAERVVPISVLNSVQANYSLEFNDVNSFENVDVYLEDNFTKTTQKLSDGFKYAVSFTSDKKSFEDGRFNLLFKPNATGIEQASLNQKFTLYPNPAQNEINLSVAGKLKGPYQYQIINQLGAVVQTSSLDFNQSTIQTIQIDGLNQGVYFVRVFNENNSQIIKFIK